MLDQGTNSSSHPAFEHRENGAEDQSTAPRRLDRGDVDLLHAHHRIKCALCFIAASG
jgi:hypothetical protein